MKLDGDERGQGTPYARKTAHANVLFILWTTVKRVCAIGYIAWGDKHATIMCAPQQQIAAAQLQWRS